MLVNLSNIIAEDNEPIVFTDNNHITPAIWGLKQELTRPTQGLTLTMNQNQWEAVVAVCAIPAFIGREAQIPLMFSDGTGQVTQIIPTETKAVTGWGADAKLASLNLVKDYWSVAEVVFAVTDYEEALWIVPSASFLGAPILVTPDSDALNALSVKYVIAIGNTDIQDEAVQIIKLTEKEDVWSFQLELFNTKGMICDYVIVTNPHDTDDSKPANIKWRFLSPAAAILAAYRFGIIQTGDWSVDRAALEAVEKATDPNSENYNKIVPGFTSLKKDSYDVENFLQTKGHEPVYFAAVGGPYAVPNFYYDIHVDYYYPTLNKQKTQYPSSLAPYATLSQSTQADRYTKEDLAAGRLAAGNIFDLTRQLMRTLFYREFLPDGEYYPYTSPDWQTKACFADGHRINQPEPDNLNWDRNKPYYPYEGVNPVFASADLKTTYYLPRNESDPYDKNMTINSIMQKTTEFGYFHFMPHGGMTNLRIEVGIDAEGNGESVFLEASTIYSLQYKAPTFIYTTCCKGSVWSLDTGYNPSDFIPSAFIHAGAVAYIATPEIQSGCFWKEAPYAVSGEQAIDFWKNIFSGNVPVGVAWRDAKWLAHKTWDDKTPKPSDISTHHVDCISYVLWGDPELETFKPKIPFSSAKELDVDVSIAQLKKGKEFTVDISVIDQTTGTPVTDASVKVTFQGTEKIGSSVKFIAPKNVGEYEISLQVSKAGYSTSSIKSMVQVTEGTTGNGDGDGGGFIPGFEGIVLLTAGTIILIALVITRYKIKK